MVYSFKAVGGAATGAEAAGADVTAFVAATGFDEADPHDISKFTFPLGLTLTWMEGPPATDAPGAPPS